MPEGAADGVRGLWAECVQAALVRCGDTDPIAFAHRLNDTRFGSTA